MSKPTIHKMEHIYGYDVCIHSTLDETGRCVMERSEALQLAKDLLDACDPSYIIAKGIDLENGDLLTGIFGGSDSCSQTASQAYIRIAKKQILAEMKQSVESIMAELAKKQKEPDVLTSATPTSSGGGIDMGLGEVYWAANDLREQVIEAHKNPYLAEIAMLIANLAARVKEQNDHPKPGSKFTCSCGLQYVYAKRV